MKILSRQASHLLSFGAAEVFKSFWLVKFCFFELLIKCPSKKRLSLIHCDTSVGFLAAFVCHRSWWSALPSSCFPTHGHFLFLQLPCPLEVKQLIPGFCTLCQTWNWQLHCHVSEKLKHSACLWELEMYQSTGEKINANDRFWALDEKRPITQGVVWAIASQQLILVRSWPDCFQNMFSQKGPYEASFWLDVKDSCRKSCKKSCSR